jgi:hypothetical protein
MKQIDTFLVTQKMLNRCVLQKQHQLKEQPPSKRMEFHGVLVAQDRSGNSLFGTCRFSVSRVGEKRVPVYADGLEALTEKKIP